MKITTECRARKYLLSASNLALALSVTLTCAAAAQYSTKLAKDLNTQSSNGPHDVIVQFSSIPSDADVAAVERAGAHLKVRFKHIRAGLFSLPASAISSISALRTVTYISPDRTVAASLEYAEPAVGADIALQSGWTGAGVGVAVIDSGVQ